MSESSTDILTSNFYIYQSKEAEITDFEVTETAFRYMKACSQTFRTLWDWSSFLPYLDHNYPKTKWFVHTIKLFILLYYVIISHFTISDRKCHCMFLKTGFETEISYV